MRCRLTYRNTFSEPSDVQSLLGHKLSVLCPPAVVQEAVVLNNAAQQRAAIGPLDPEHCLLQDFHLLRGQAGIMRLDLVKCWVLVFARLVLCR